MKTLHNHTLLYDDECPLCKTYTAGFVRTQMLDKNGRIPFSECPDNIACNLDRVRACDEIALVDRSSGKVTYGVESLFIILENRFPVLKIIFTCKPFVTAMKILYAFISYNRKVIIPGKFFEGDGTCTPTFHLTYRWAYIIFAWFVSSLILAKYSMLLTDFLPKGNPAREYVICAGQILFQAATISFIRRDRVIHYLGNMMTISLAGSLLLIPGIVLHYFVHLDNSMIYLAWFGIVVNLMFLEHLRRTKILEIHFLSSVSWVTYRLLVLITIFYLL